MNLFLVLDITLRDIIHYTCGKCSKISNIFSLFSKNKLVIRAGTHKMLSEKQTGKTLIRLLLQKQSDLGLPCLCRLLWQANFNYCSKF